MQSRIWTSPCFFFQLALKEKRYCGKRSSDYGWLQENYDKMTDKALAQTKYRRTWLTTIQTIKNVYNIFYKNNDDSLFLLSLESRLLLNHSFDYLNYFLKINAKSNVNKTHTNFILVFLNYFYFYRIFHFYWKWMKRTETSVNGFAAISHYPRKYNLIYFLQYHFNYNFNFCSY